MVAAGEHYLSALRNRRRPCQCPGLVPPACPPARVRAAGAKRLIYVGIDDTDTLDTPGTNQLARALAAQIASTHECLLIVRHQLLDDPRVPYTSKNGSAS